MDILQLYQDFSIPHQTEEHKHCRPGWVNTACPFCTGNPGLHLGASLDGGRFYCWRCGGHPQRKALSKLLNIPEHKVKDIIREYGGVISSKEAKVTIHRKIFKLPSFTDFLQPQHIKYLIKRNFDPDLIQKEWGVLGTGPLAKLDHIDYSHRIIIPIRWDNNTVTFQGRDITDKHPMKYLACSKEREAIHHKDIVYGKQEAWGTTGICVEGITDVWRLGTNAFCTFGIEYKAKQLRLIAKTFSRVAVVFDDDPQAVKQADKMVNDLLFRGVDAFRIDIEGDPGAMSDDDAKHLVNNVL